MNLVKHLTRRWNRFFFTPDSAENSAVCRILFYGGLLALNWNQNFADWGRVADVFWMPERCWPFEYFNIPLLPPPMLGLMAVVWKVSLTLSCLGLLTRLFSVMSFALGFYLLGLPNCFGDLAHGDAATVLILGVMGIARVGTRCRLIARSQTSAQRSAASTAGQCGWLGSFYRRSSLLPGMPNCLKADWGGHSPIIWLSFWQNISFHPNILRHWYRGASG